MGRLACNQLDWDIQRQRETRPVCHTCLTSGQAIGLSFATLAGSISLASVLALFYVVAVKWWDASPTCRGELFKPLNIFMLNLFVAELFISLGGVFEGKWAYEAQVYCGEYCDAQASLHFLGQTVAYARRVYIRLSYSLGIVAAVWIYVFAFNFGARASANALDDEDPANFFTPTPFWCSIGRSHKDKRPAHYIWLWIMSVGNIVVYVSLFLLLRGNIVLGNEGNLLSAEWHSTPLPPRTEQMGDNVSTLSVASGEDSEETRKDCWKMLYYPLTTIAFPLVVIRWITLANPHLDALTMPPLGTAMMVFHILYRLSGAINVALVLVTRPNVLLLGKRNREEDEEEDARGAGGGRNTGDENEATG
ncbi:hypothetical protein FRC12_000495 [Ceratobasidium sp. 428]|nr:hypothetical protein FRC12_000495 [Ceratobasidium sp. 428]